MNPLFSLPSLISAITPTPSTAVPGSGTPGTQQPGGDDIRPIHDTITIPPQISPEHTSYGTIILWSIAGVLLLAGIIALLLWLKRRAEARRIPNLQQKALKKLEKASELMTASQSRAYSIAVSDILRQFIEERFYLPSTRRTSDEFLQDLSRNPHIDLGPYRENLEAFFEQSDRGKFSGDSLSQSLMQSLHDTARQVIESESTQEKEEKISTSQPNTPTPPSEKNVD